MGELSVTPIDIAVLVVILVSAGFAMFRGLVHETLAILAWIAGGYAALRLTPVAMPLVHGSLGPGWLERLAVPLGIFLIVFVPLAYLSRWISGRVKSSVVGGVDRLLGLAFGAARGLVIVALAYLAFAALVPSKSHPAALTQARLFPLIRDTSDVLRSIASTTYGAGERGTLDTTRNGRH